MKIAIIGANGKAGRLIAQEGKKRGHSVTAIVRDRNKVKDMDVLEKDIVQLAYEDIKDYDVLVNAFGVWEEDKLFLHALYAKHLCDILSGSKVRLLVVGGAGSLYVDSSHTMRLYETPDFPDIFKPVALATAKALEEIRIRDDVQWTYLSPAAEFDVEGMCTNSYTVGGEEIILNSKGKSYISYADYAIALLDEIEKPQHIKQRYTVVSG